MIGIDIVDIKRFEQIKGVDYKYWEKTFTRAEWDYAFSSAKTAERFAGIYAAKEAIMKAVGEKLLGRFDLIEIIYGEAGGPAVSIKGGGKQKISVSISHDGGIAAAVALLNP